MRDTRVRFTERIDERIRSAHGCGQCRPPRSAHGCGQCRPPGCGRCRPPIDLGEVSSNTFLDGPCANGNVVLWANSHDNMVIAHVGELVTDLGTNNVVVFVDRSADLNADGTIDAADLALLLGAWGGCSS